MYKYYIFISILGVVVLTCLIVGFSLVGSPLDRKSRSYDNQTSYAFSSIKRSIEIYYLENKQLPASLDDLDLFDTKVANPKTEEAFEYIQVDKTNYQLCTEFFTNSDDLPKEDSYSYYGYRTDALTYTKGHNCISFSVESNAAVTPAVPTPIATVCEKTTYGNIEDSLVAYTVKEGDTLQSIAANELNDTSRMQEIAVMNGDRYPSLFASTGVAATNPELIEGWKLLLPPDWLQRSSGQLDEVNGKVLAIRASDKGLEISSTDDASDHYATLTIDGATVNQTGVTYSEGDCITAIRDIRQNKVLRIGLQ